MIEISLRTTTGQGFPKGKRERDVPHAARPFRESGEASVYFRCLLTSFVISNIET